MIIGINARILDQSSVRGWSRYTYNLIRELCTRNIDLKFYSDKPLDLRWIPKDRHKDVYILGSGKYIYWEQVVLKRLAESHGVHALHCPTNYGLPYFGNFKKVLTLHDAIEKSYYSEQLDIIKKMRLSYIKNRLLHAASYKAADKIITVSEFAKKDIIESYGIKPDKISVIYEAADEAMSSENIKSEEALYSKWKIKPSYLFYIGGLEQRKNIPFILELAKREPQHVFVIAGGGQNNHKANSPSNVQFLGYVEEEWLSSLYYYSKAFLYPSFQEGFGLQIVESLKLGKPALYANTSSLPEVYGTMEYGFNPYNVDEAQSMLVKLNKNYANAVAFAKQRSDFFSWSKTADQTIDLYRSLL